MGMSVRNNCGLMNRIAVWQPNGLEQCPTWPTDRQTDRPRYSVCSNRPHLMHCNHILCRSFGHVREPYKNVWTDRDAFFRGGGLIHVGPRNLFAPPRRIVYRYKSNLTLMGRIQILLHPRNPGALVIYPAGWTENAQVMRYAPIDS